MDIFATSSTLGMRRKHFFTVGKLEILWDKIWEAGHDRVISLLGAGQNPSRTNPSPPPIFV